MPKILDLRKKQISQKKLAQAPQRPREKVGATDKPAIAVKYNELTQKNIESPRQSVSGPHESASPKISWEAPSFYYNPQKRYLSLIIASLMLGTIAMLTFGDNILTSIFLILSSLVLLLYGSQKPAVSKIKVDQSGILVNDSMYCYKDLKSFWIDYDPRGQKELSLESAKWYMPYVKILLNDQNPVEVRSLVINFLPEKEHENSLVDQIGRRLGL